MATARGYAASPYTTLPAPAVIAEHTRELVEEARADIPAIIEAIRVAREAPADHSGHIDHTPGGSPERYTGAAPAPRHEWRRPERFSAFRRELAPDGRVSLAELQSRAYAATRQALRGKGWSEDQRLDAASAVVEAVLRRESIGLARHGRPREVLAWITFAERFPHEAARRERANVATVSRAAASGLALYRLASNERRAMERAEGRMDEAVHAAFTAELAAPDAGTQLRTRPDLAASPRKARLTAVHMLADLDVSTAWGPLLTVAYTAARAPAGTDGRDVARELELSHTAYRKHVSRGVKALAENVTDRQWALASLHMLDPLAGTGGAHAASLETDWRTTAPAAPVTLKRMRKAPRRTPAAWTTELPERTRNRLHAVATARQERAGLAPEHRTRATV